MTHVTSGPGCVQCVQVYLVLLLLLGIYLTLFL